MSSRLVLARKRRRALLIDLLGGHCVSCSTTDNIEFDHVFPEEMEFRIGTAVLMKLDTLLPELQKCQLLCNSCHWDKTRTETKRVLDPKHGTASSYNNYKCRCHECKSAWSRYVKSKNYYRK